MAELPGALLALKAGRKCRQFAPWYSPPFAITHYVKNQISKEHKEYCPFSSRWMEILERYPANCLQHFSLGDGIMDYFVFIIFLSMFSKCFPVSIDYFCNKNFKVM